MLETIRQYAFDRLVEAAEMEGMRDHHLAYFCKLMEEANPHLMRELTSRTMNVVAFQESPRTLEQVYLNVMVEARGGLNAE